MAPLDRVETLWHSGQRVRTRRQKARTKRDSRATSEEAKAPSCCQGLPIESPSFEIAKPIMLQHNNREYSCLHSFLFEFQTTLIKLPRSEACSSFFPVNFTSRTTNLISRAINVRTREVSHPFSLSNLLGLSTPLLIPFLQVSLSRSHLSSCFLFLLSYVLPRRSLTTNTPNDNGKDLDTQQVIFLLLFPFFCDSSLPCSAASFIDKTR